MYCPLLGFFQLPSQRAQYLQGIAGVFNSPRNVTSTECHYRFLHHASTHASPTWHVVDLVAYVAVVVASVLIGIIGSGINMVSTLFDMSHPLWFHNVTTTLTLSLADQKTTWTLYTYHRTNRFTNQANQEQFSISELGLMNNLSTSKVNVNRVKISQSLNYNTLHILSPHVHFSLKSVWRQPRILPSR